jgi:hypothetical protein
MEKLLLLRFLELYSLDNKVETWSLKKFADNPPRLYRLQMIDSLMAALEIKCSYIEFMYGEFLYEDKRTDWQIFRKIVQDNYQTGFDFVQEEDSGSANFQFIFELLFKFQIRYYQLINTKSMIIEASGVSRIPVNIVNEIEIKIANEFLGNAKILYYILNPNGIFISEDDLKKNYHFPDVDLLQIDRDWI